MTTDPSTSITATTDPPIADSSESSTGAPAECGNNVIDEGEECDNGGSDLYCDGDCTVVECGDGYENFPAGEYCDPGAAGETALCNNDCSLSMCGDMVVNMSAGEDCDDGETTLTCNGDCTTAACGDGVLNEKGGEECDDSGESVNCNADCTEAECGDSQINATAGEECDDGPKGSPTCDANCQDALCGDGVVSPPQEQCDDQGESASCNADCTDADCGDGQINMTAGEECDDGGESVDCDDDCTPAFCGDGNSNFAAGEICDDGNQVPDDFCDNNCFADCGNDCWGDEGCITDGGRCVRFTCAAASESDTACDSCFGWEPVTHENWLNDGYCEDISAIYRATEGYAPKCGGAAQCCSDPADCGEGNNAWHFNDGVNNYYTGPCIGCVEPDNCTYWNFIEEGNYTRLTACVRG